MAESAPNDLRPAATLALALLGVLAALVQGAPVFWLALAVDLLVSVVLAHLLWSYLRTVGWDSPWPRAGSIAVLLLAIGFASSPALVTLYRREHDSFACADMFRPWTEEQL